MFSEKHRKKVRRPKPLVATRAMTSLRPCTRRATHTPVTLASQSDNVLDADVTQHGDTEDGDSPLDATQRRKKLTRRRPQKSDVIPQSVDKRVGSLVGKSKSFVERGVSVDGACDLLSPTCHSNALRHTADDLTSTNIAADTCTQQQQQQQQHQGLQTKTVSSLDVKVETGDIDVIPEPKNIEKSTQRNSPSKQVNFSPFPKYKNFDYDVGDQATAKEGIELCDQQR